MGRCVDRNFAECTPLWPNTSSRRKWWIPSVYQERLRHSSGCSHHRHTSDMYRFGGPFGIVGRDEPGAPAYVTSTPCQDIVGCV